MERMDIEESTMLKLLIGDNFQLFLILDDSILPPVSPESGKIH